MKEIYSNFAREISEWPKIFIFLWIYHKIEKHNMYIILRIQIIVIQNLTVIINET